MTPGVVAAYVVGLIVCCVIFTGMIHIDSDNAHRSLAAVTDRRALHYENAVEVANQAAILANQKALLQHQGLPYVEPVYPPDPKD